MRAMSAVDWNEYYKGRLPSTLDELRTLVEMESPSGQADGIRHVVGRLAHALEDAGGVVEIVDDHPNGPNLVARFEGQGRPVMLLGHTDTVWPVGTIDRLPFRVDDGRAFGPGVLDMKSGCLVVVEALRGLRAHALRPAVVVVFNCDEEIGSRSSRHMIEREALAARAVLVFEPSIPGGLAKTSRSGVADYTIRVHGTAAHAGVDPEKGVSAVLAGAALVSRLHGLNDLDNGLSVNVGIFTGGTRKNVIAAESELHVDVRYRRQSQGRIVDERIRSLASSLEDVRVDIAGGLGRGPLEPTDAVLALYARAAECARASGFEMGRGHVGGVSDGNFTAALGVPTLDGLGLDGMGSHADHEHIVVEDLWRRSAMLARLLVDLAG